MARRDLDRLLGGLGSRARMAPGPPSDDLVSELFCAGAHGNPKLMRTVQQKYHVSLRFPGGQVFDVPGFVDKGDLQSLQSGMSGCGGRVTVHLAADVYEGLAGVSSDDIHGVSDGAAMAFVSELLPHIIASDMSRLERLEDVANIADHGIVLLKQWRRVVLSMADAADEQGR